MCQSATITCYSSEQRLARALAGPAANEQPHVLTGAMHMDERGGDVDD